MKSFDDLELHPNLIEALSAEGIETPHELQEKVLPSLLRGHNLVIDAGPGSGAATAAIVGVLSRLIDDESHEPPSILIVTASDSAAGYTAESVSRIVGALGLRLAALGSDWALPELAHVLVGSSKAVVAGLQQAELKLDNVRSILVLNGSSIQERGGLADLETLFESAPKEAQRVLVSLPLTSEIRNLTERHLQRAMIVPDKSSRESAPPKSRSHELVYHVFRGSREEATLSQVSRLIEDGGRHVLVFCRSEDRVADLGDYLTLHGYLADAPGTETAPVWITADERAARESTDESVDDSEISAVSHDVPADADALNLRHQGVAHNVVVVEARELSHLRRAARLAGGYGLRPTAHDRTERIQDELKSLEDRLRKRLRDGGFSTSYLALIPLLDDYSPVEVAAAAASLLMEAESRPAAPQPQIAEASPTWTKLFISVGSRDGAGPRDLLGAVTGESQIKGQQVGRIDVRDNYSLVEVDAAVADKVLKSLNGTTILGRSVRADLHRQRRPEPHASRQRR